MSKKKSVINESENQLTGLLAQGGCFEGEVLFDGIFRIDGNLSGRVICNRQAGSTVIVSCNSIVEADIIADNIIISGRVLGNLLAMNKIEVFPEGRLEGMIFTQDLVMKTGALFHGQCIMLKNYTQEQKSEIKEDLLENKTPRILSDLSKPDPKIYHLNKDSKVIPT